MLSTESTLPQTFDSREQAKQVVSDLIDSARREINFFGSNIDHTLFDNNEVIEKLSAFARRNQRTVIRFLVHSTSENSRKGHKLITLSQRLTSSILIHQTESTQRGDNDMFLLVDDRAYAYFKTHHFYQGNADIDNPYQVKKLKQRFDNMWNKSTLDTSVRRLDL